MSVEVSCELGMHVFKVFFCHFRSLSTSLKVVLGYFRNNLRSFQAILITIKGKARSLRALDELFMVMCRLRQGFLKDHLARLFNVSASTVSRIFRVQVQFCSSRLDIKPFNSQIKFVLLLIVNHTILIMFVRRSQFQVN